MWNGLDHSSTPPSLNFNAARDSERVTKNNGSEPENNKYFISIIEKSLKAVQLLLWKITEYSNEFFCWCCWSTLPRLLIQGYHKTMSVTVKINRFCLPKAKSNLIGRIEFRGKFESSYTALVSFVTSYIITLWKKGLKKKLWKKKKTLLQTGSKKNL